MNQQQIDWPGIRAAAVALGVREAARQATADLPADERKRFANRVMQRCHREQWLAVKRQHNQPLTKASENSAKPLSAAVSTGSAVIGKAVIDNCNRARTLLSAAAVKGARAFSELDGCELTEKGKSTAFRNVTAATSDIGGWKDDKADRSQNVMINLQLLNG